MFMVTLKKEFSVVALPVLRLSVPEVGVVKPAQIIQLNIIQLRKVSLSLKTYKSTCCMLDLTALQHRKLCRESTIMKPRPKTRALQHR